jgi:hypothetical protein
MGFDLNFIKCRMCFQSLFIYFFWGGGGGGGGGGLLGLLYSLNIQIFSSEWYSGIHHHKLLLFRKVDLQNYLSKFRVIPTGCHNSWIHFLFCNLIWAATGIASFFFLIILLILKYRKQFIWYLPLFFEFKQDNHISFP